MNQKGFANVIAVVVVVLLAVAGYFYFTRIQTERVTEEQTNGREEDVYENAYMKVSIPTGWTAKQANQTIYYGECTGFKTDCTTTPKVEPNPAAVNITKGNYILYINTQASQASGAEGGRFSEIAMGLPSADAVVTEWPSECGTPEIIPIATTNHPRVDLYVGIADKKEWCNVPENGKTVWFFSYITNSADKNSTGRPYFNYYENPNSGAMGYVITMSYNSKDVNAFPVKGSTELNSMLSEMTDIIKTLEIKQIPNTKDETATSKTYKNAQYGFEFSYPLMYVIYDASNDSKVVGELLRVSVIGPTKEEINFGPASTISVSVWDNSKKLSLVDWASDEYNRSFSNYNADGFANFKNLTLAGHKAISYSWEGLGSGKTAIIENGQTIILVTTLIRDDETSREFDNVVSTFKFTK